MDKNEIITQKLRGRSNRDLAKDTGINRKTIAKYWQEYQQQVALLGSRACDRELQQLICEQPKYNTSSRKPVKYNDAIDSDIDAILVEEKEKNKLLGSTHKQHLSCKQIHELIVQRGHDIGLSTVTKQVGIKRQRAKEAFIRQEYDFGQRLEYDFGEVMLVIDGVKGTYHMAAIASPASDNRWAYLYTNQRKEVFLDSHVRYFEMMGGVWQELVYDNMRNVVSRFIGKTEKQLNCDLIKMSNYYGFSINVTNCYSGNEKGFVESSVKFIRNKVFAKRYCFDSFNEASQYLQDELVKLNSRSLIEEERKCLMTYRPPLELAKITEQNVDKYSFVCVENNFYSVPDYLVGHNVVIKNYLASIDIFSGTDKVCSHSKVDGYHEMQVNIFHYLRTLERKPKALKNSKALRSIAQLKELFDRDFTDRPRKFIELLHEHSKLSNDELVNAFQASLNAPSAYIACPKSQLAQNVADNTRRQLAELTASAMIGGGCCDN
jgi:DNA-binding transcriptional regulator YhcF (GntR family)